MTYATVDTVDLMGGELVVDAKNDTATWNGKTIPYGTHTYAGNKITKQGGTVTIETPDGQKVVIEDKGDHLDTTVTFKDMQTHQLGGMMGDVLAGKPKNSDPNAYAPVASDNSMEGPSSDPSNRVIQVIRPIPAIRLIRAPPPILENSDPDGGIELLPPYNPSDGDPNIVPVNYYRPHSGHYLPQQGHHWAIQVLNFTVRQCR